VSPMVVIFGCVAFGAAFVLFIVGAYKVRQYHRWRALVRQVTPHKQASLTLQAGETLVAVVELNKGTYFFLGAPTRKGSYSD
jgi:hypothetical protein